MWTPEKAARLAELEAGYYGQAPQAAPEPQAPRMGLGGRLLRQVANTPAHILNMGQQIGDTLLGIETPNRQIFDVPEAQTTGEAVTDFIGQLPAELATLATGAGAATKGLRAAGVGKRIAPILGEAAAGAASGLRTSGEEAAAQSAEFGAMGGLMQAFAKRNPLGRAILSGAGSVGVGAAGQLARGNDLTSPEALQQMAIMGLLPAAQEGLGAASRRLLRRAEPPAVVANVDEVLPPQAPETLALPGPSVAPSARHWNQLEWSHGNARTYEPSGAPIIPGRPSEIPQEAFALPGPTRPAQDRLPRLEWPHGEARTFSRSGEPIIIPTPDPISPQTEPAAPSVLRSGEPAQAGGGLRPLRSSEAGAVNPMALAPVIGAGVGAITENDNPLQGALIGAAIATGGAKGARFLRSAKLREAADRQMRPNESSPSGRIARFMEKNMNLGKDSRLTALDDRAKGEADFWATRMINAQKAAGEMAYGKNLTPAQKAAGDAFITSKGDPVDLAKLRASGAPAEYQRFLETSKDAQKQMQRIYMGAESDPRKQNLIANTLGTYQTRQYRYFLQPDEFKIDPSQKAAVINEWKSNPIFAGVDPAIVDDVVTKDLEQHLRDLSSSGGDFSRLANEGKSKISQSLFKSRKDLTPNYRKLLGEVSDPHEANVLTASKLMQSVAQAKVVGDLRTSKDSAGNRFAMPQQEWQSELLNARRAGDTAREQALLNRYVDAPDSPGLGALAGQKVQRQVADYFQFAGHEGLKTGDGSWYAMLNSVPKAVFTRLNPAAWVRNYGQAALQGHALGIWDPSRIIKTAWRISKDPALREELQRSGVLGAHAGRHEFGQQAKKLGDALDKGVTGRLKAAMAAINEGYGKPDTWLRATAYLDELEKGIAKGLSRDEAGLKALEFVNRYSHNYGQVPKVVGKLRNLPVVNPFLAYSTEMARIVKNLATDVVTGNERAITSGGALLSLLAMPAMLTYAAKEFGLTDEQQKELDSIRDLMPPYMRGRLNATYTQDEKGEFKSANLQPWMPAGDMVSLARNILAGDTEALIANNPVASTSGTPLLNAYTELRTGKDLVTGQKTTPTEIVAKNVVPMYYRGGQILKSLTPNEDGGRGIEEASGRLITPGNAIAGALGFSGNSVSTKRLLRRLDAQTKDELNDAKREASGVLRSNAAAHIKEAARQEFAEKKRRILLRRHELLQGVQ